MSYQYHPTTYLHEIWNDYKEFHEKLEITPMHVTQNTIASMGDLVELNRLLHASLGLTGESAEVSELIKKCLYGQQKPFTDQTAYQLKDELSDVFWYFTLALRALDLDLRDIMAHNMEKLSKRYPELL